MIRPLSETLLAFSRKTVTTPEVLRALLEHTGWIVPTSLFDPLTTRGADGKLELSLPYAVHMLGQREVLPARELHIFADYSHMQRAIAAGATLALCAQDVPGHVVFDLVDARYDAVRMNGGSAPEEGFFIGSGAFDNVKLRGRAIAVEAALRRHDPNGRPVDAVARLVRGFPGYQTLLDVATSNVITLEGAVQGVPSAGVVFTTPESTTRFLETKIPEARRATIKTVTVGGDVLFPFLVDQGVGAIFNPAGFGFCCAVDRAFCSAIASATEPG
jgi:hypothetical protein